MPDVVFSSVPDELVRQGFSTYKAGDFPGDPGLHYRRDLPPGTGHWDATLGEAMYLSFTCPCGCGVIGALEAIAPGANGDGWQWNGDQEFPTLTPSIWKKYGCGWHGFLTNGLWVTV